MNIWFADASEEDVAVASDCEIFYVVAARELVNLRDRRDGWDFLTLHYLACYQDAKS